MGPEIIALATAGVTKAALDGLMEAIGADAAKSGSAYAKSAIKRWQTDRTLQAVCERSKRIRKVKTIWQFEKEVDLVKFYYPSKVKSSSEPAKEVHRLQDFSYEGNLVVRGIVGQGKSTFLRYLAARELERGERIPVFVELRRLALNESVLDAVIDEMKNLGLEGASAEVVEYLGKSSRLALLLDGFDEVPEEKVSALVQELENLSVRMPGLRMIVTSRPENAIERSPHFRVFDLAPLAPGEYAKVIARITPKQSLAEEIVNGISKSHSSIARLLTTPLMVSLLLVRYKVDQGIPENRVAFYEPLFMLLLQRHDTAKSGFKRRRKSKLSDSQLLTFFNCLCFITRKAGVSVLRESALNGAAARALKWANLDGAPDTAVEDIHRITCLILKDGLDEYRFLHKSVQEFHAACFVRDQTDTLAAEFYAAMQQHWSEWEQELLFLKTIHQDRYDRYFAIPMLDRVVSTLVGASPTELGRALIGRLIARVMLRPQPEFLNIVYPRDPVGWCLMNYFEGSVLFEGIAEASVRLATTSPPPQQPGVDYCDIPVREVLAALAPSHERALDTEAEALGQRIGAALEERRRRMHTLDERKGLFDI
ncbi:MAG: NACHT domain-containing protein [Myxococcota bacterium]